MTKMYSVNCMMCGRSSGQVRQGAFYRASTAPPLDNRTGHFRCGFCTGNLYLEPDDSLLATLPAGEALYKQRQLAS